MLRNLKYGVVVFAIAFSSCSTSNQIASTTGVDNDDVYYTEAKAGDQIIYADAGQSNSNQQYNDDDDYYYYGDYASRINRFGYYSPFSYYDNYYGYSPYSRFGFGMGLGFGFNSGFWNGYYSPFMYGGINSPYFYDPYFSGYYGYSPFGYGYGLGYGYGGYGYGGYLGYGGYYGGLGGFAGRYQNPRPVYAGGVARPGNYTGGTNGTRVNGFMTVPNRRQPSGTNVPNINNATRGIRSPGNQNPRPVIQQVERQPSYSPPPSNSGGGNFGGGGGGGGGGGRPVRP